MSKLTVAELIGETPEMLRACGEVLKYNAMLHHYAQKAFQDPRWENSADYCKGALEGARENVARMMGVCDGAQ